jgi:hypothetical protein
MSANSVPSSKDQYFSKQPPYTHLFRNYSRRGISDYKIISLNFYIFHKNYMPNMDFKSNNRKWTWWKSIGKPRVSPLRFLNTSAVMWYLICIYTSDSSAVRRLFLLLLEPWNVRELYIRKTADLPLLWYKMCT